MQNKCIKQNENIYFRCRKEAAKYDERLCSRESTADLLYISVSSLADYELGNTKVIPVDKVNLMAELYSAPQLRTLYCKTNCPFRDFVTMATAIPKYDSIVLKLLEDMEDDKMKEIKKKLVNIATNGGVSKTNVHSLSGIFECLDGLAEDISALKLLCVKVKAGNGGV